MRPSKEAQALVDGLIERHGYLASCWGWRFRNWGTADLRWQCQSCGDRCKGARPWRYIVDGKIVFVDWCHRCRFLEHLAWCPAEWKDE